MYAFALFRQHRCRTDVFLERRCDTDVVPEHRCETDVVGDGDGGRGGKGNRTDSSAIMAGGRHCGSRQRWTVPAAASANVGCGPRRLAPEDAGWVAFDLAKQVFDAV